MFSSDNGLHFGDIHFVLPQPLHAVGLSPLPEVSGRKQSLIVHHVGSEFFNLDGILPFVHSLENDLKEARERQGKEVSWV